MNDSGNRVAQHRMTVKGIPFYWEFEPTFGRTDPETINALPVDDEPEIAAPDPLDLNNLRTIKQADDTFREPDRGAIETWVKTALETALRKRAPALIDYLERCYEAADMAGRADVAADIQEAFQSMGRDLSRESTVEINAPEIEHDDFSAMEVRIGLDSATRARIEAIRNDGWKDALSALGVRELRIPQGELEQGTAEFPGSTLRVRPQDETDREISMLGLRAGERPDLELIIGRDCAYVAWGPYTSDRLRFDDPAIAFDEAHDASARGDLAARMNGALSPAHCVLRSLGAEDAEEGTRMLNEVQEFADGFSAPAPDDDERPR